MTIADADARTVEVRDYDRTRDEAAVQRIWREVGWIDDEDRHRDALTAFLDGGHGLVAPVVPDGDAECLVHRTAGTWHHDGTDLPLCAITAVTTSHVARKQGVATRLMAEALARGADDGAVVASLGAFEQGYYDRFGFGTGPYEHVITIDPATLVVPVPERPPVRVGAEDLDELHALLGRRHRTHGAVTLEGAGTVRAEHGWLDDGFGLGFRDADDGRLTHAFLGSMKDEHGPYRISLIAYEDPAGLLELLGVIRSLGDQVRLVAFEFEPAEIQLQDLVHHPVRQRITAGLGGRSWTPHSAGAWWQVRILDLPAATAALACPAGTLDLDLELTDPLAERGGRWPGIGGPWQVHLGPTSHAAPGRADDGRPTVRASVNAWSRLWAGIRPASSLALTDDLHAAPAVLAALDDLVRLPLPRPGLEH